MRSEAPVYYSDQYDFYALTRHEDVAAAYKNYETYSSAYGVDLATVQTGGPSPDVRLLQFMDPPEHRQMRSHPARGDDPVGKPVFLMLASANRDPEAWTDADKFDIERDRTEAQNIGLGYGIHSCLGAALARMETAIALDKLLDFMPRYEVDWGSCRRVQMANVGGWASVPVDIIH